jgi:LmbE family N-acetylglucosaminyl deacetylase
VLVLGAHPDDETLAAGGTMARLAAAGGEVTVVSATGGEGSWSAGLRRRRAAARRLDALDIACGWLGVTAVACLGLPDGGLATAEQRLRLLIDEWVQRTRPLTIVAPWPGDGHADHRALHRAARSVAAAHRMELWGGEVWTPLPATHLVDISGHPVARKRIALAAHATAGRALQLDAVLGLNRYRAMAATPGCEAAEAFVVTSTGTAR